MDSHSVTLYSTNNFHISAHECQVLAVSERCNASAESQVPTCPVSPLNTGSTIVELLPQSTRHFA